MNTATDTAPNSQTTPDTPSEEIDRVLLRTELRGLLNVSKETMRRWLKENRLPRPDVEISRRTLGWKVSTLRRAGIDLL
jgi:predicted DNA-binding transcriptional regulator AlpA